MAPEVPFYLSLRNHLGMIAHVGLLEKSFSTRGVYDFQRLYAVAPFGIFRLAVVASIARAFAAYPPAQFRSPLSSGGVLQFAPGRLICANSFQLVTHWPFEFLSFR